MIGHAAQLALLYLAKLNGSAKIACYDEQSGYENAAFSADIFQVAVELTGPMLSAARSVASVAGRAGTCCVLGEMALRPFGLRAKIANDEKCR